MELLGETNLVLILFRGYGALMPSQSQQIKMAKLLLQTPLDKQIS